MENKVVDGKNCVVMHISEHRHLGRSICTGEKFQLPSQDDTRPRVLCDQCRIRARDQKGTK